MKGVRAVQIVPDIHCSVDKLALFKNWGTAMLSTIQPRLRWEISTIQEREVVGLI